MSRPRYLADNDFNDPVLEGLLRLEPAVEVLSVAKLVWLAHVYCGGVDFRGQRRGKRWNYRGFSRAAVVRTEKRSDIIFRRLLVSA